MRKSSGGTHSKHEPPVEQYRKEIGKHQEIIENPSSVKKRHDHKEKMKGDTVTEPEQDIKTGALKTVQMLVLWIILIGGAYCLIQYLMRPSEHPFSGNN